MASWRIQGAMQRLQYGRSMFRNVSLKHLLEFLSVTLMPQLLSCVVAPCRKPLLARHVTDLATHMYTQRDTAVPRMSHKRQSPGRRPHGDTSTRVARFDPKHVGQYLPTCKSGARLARASPKPRSGRLEQLAMSSRVCSQELPNHIGAYTPNVPRGHYLARRCAPLR